MAPSETASAAVAQPSLPGAAAPLQQVIPADIRTLLGAAPLTNTEDAGAYERILTQTALAISPTNYIEWMWVKELVDLAWEAQRARRAIRTALALARKRAIREILKAHRQGKDSYSIAFGNSLWDDAHAIYYGEPDQLAEFQDVLFYLGLPSSAVDDAAYLAERETVEKLEQMVERACARRNDILREIDRSRRVFAERARQAAEAIEPAIEAEFE